jgi:hypothetical protein
VADSHAGRGRAETPAIPGVPFLGPAGSTGGIIFRRIGQDGELALHLHGEISLIRLTKTEKWPIRSSRAADESILEHIMNKKTSRRCTKAPLQHVVFVRAFLGAFLMVALFGWPA